MATDLILYRKGMDYGVGIDSPSGEARNTGVLGTATDIPNAGGSIIEYQLTEVSSDEDLQTSLGISASASGGVGLFSASASMDFARKCHVHSNSVFLLASVKVTLAFSQIVAPKIQPEAAAKLVDSDPTRFQEMYGDSFVRGIQTGGRFFAVVEVFTSSSSEQESLSISLQGSYGAFSGKGSFSSEFSDAVSKRSLKISVYQEGGVVPKEPTSLEEVQAIASTFAASVEGHAVPYAVLLDKYTILDLPNPPNYIDLQNQMEVLAFCAERRSAIWTALNNVDYIIGNPGQFESKPGEDLIAPLGAYRTALELDLKNVTTAASQALDHPKNATPPVLTAIPPKFPKRLAGEADDLATRGEALTNADPLATALRDNEPQGESRRGFHIGMATEANNTLWGPGAQSIKDSLGTAAQQGFSIAVAYCLQRNNNMDMSRRGLAVVTADPAAQSARKRLPVGLSWLGFNIASGIFGKPALGALGNTAMGPGSQKIRASLDADAQRGFDAAVALYVTK